MELTHRNLQVGVGITHRNLQVGVGITHRNLQVGVGTQLLVTGRSSGLSQPVDGAERSSGLVRKSIVYLIYQCSDNSVLRFGTLKC